MYLILRNTPTSAAFVSLMADRGIKLEYVLNWEHTGVGGRKATCYTLPMVMFGRPDIIQSCIADTKFIPSDEGTDYSDVTSDSDYAIWQNGYVSSRG